MTKEHSNVSQIKFGHQQQDNNQQSSNHKIMDNNYVSALPPSTFPTPSSYLHLSTTAETISMATSILLNDSHMSSSNINTPNLNVDNVI